MRDHRNGGFVLAAYVFFVTMLGTTLPTPLYPLFQQRYAFGDLLVTVIFAIYAVGVIAGLIVFGNLSDQLGRRAPLALGLSLSAANALLFLFAHSLAPIYVARIVSGLSAGIFTGTATAYLVDLSRRGRRFGSLVAVVANLGGLGAGTLMSGLLAQYAGHPLRLPFAVDLGLVAIAAVALWRTPETVERSGERRFRLQRLGVPSEVASVFVRAATAGFAGFAVSGVFSSVAPVFLGQALHRHSPALAGLLVFVLFATSIGGQLLIVRLPNALATGCGLLVAGTALLAVAVGIDSLTALFASSVVAGLGQGMVVSAGLAAINERAPAKRRGETASSFFVVLYVGLAVPVVAAGVAIHYTSIHSAGFGFCAAVALLTLGVLATELRGTD